MDVLRNGYIGMFSYQNWASLRIFIFHCCWERFLYPNPILVMVIILWNDPPKCNATTSNALQCTLYTWFRQFKCAKLSFLRRQKPAMCVSVPFPGPSLNMTASISSFPGRIRLRQKCLKTTSPNPSKSFEYDLKTVVLTPKPQIIKRYHINDLNYLIGGENNTLKRTWKTRRYVLQSPKDLSLPWPHKCKLQIVSRRVAILLRYLPPFQAALPPQRRPSNRQLRKEVSSERFWSNLCWKILVDGLVFAQKSLKTRCF